MIDMTKIYERYFPDRITRQGFIGNALAYIKQLLNSPTTAKVSDYLENYGVTSEKLLKELLDNRILIRSEKIRRDDDGKDSFCISYKPGKKNVNYNSVLRAIKGETSLVVQGLRLRAPNAGAWVQFLVKELDPACCN